MKPKAKNSRPVLVLNGGVMTQRDLNVLGHLSNGETTRHIAGIENISHRTVEAICDKWRGLLGVPNTAALLCELIRKNII